MGFLAHAVLATVLIIGINLLLRPAMTWINRKLPAAPAEGIRPMASVWSVEVRMRPTCELFFSRAWPPETCTSSSLKAPTSKAATASRWRPHYARTSAMMRRWSVSSVA